MAPVDGTIPHNWRKGRTHLMHLGPRHEARYLALLSSLQQAPVFSSFLSLSLSCFLTSLSRPEADREIDIRW
jgi:hypothetical protein